MLPQGVLSDSPELSFKGFKYRENAPGITSVAIDT